MTVAILLADDHPLIRRGLRNLLEAETGFSVVGEAEDGLDVVQLAEKLHPDVVVMDLMMPNLNGLEALKQIRRRSSKSRVIILSMQSADAYVLEALRSGACGYVLKDSAPDEILNAIHACLLDRRYLSPKLPERLIHTSFESAQTFELDPYETLTTREREVLQMASEGKTASEIAKIISISPRTAELHRTRMMKKLGLHGQTELVRYAVKRGILPPDT